MTRTFSPHALDRAWERYGLTLTAYPKPSRTRRPAAALLRDAMEAE